jgi:hypothetical protein
VHVTDEDLRNGNTDGDGKIKLALGGPAVSGASAGNGPRGDRYPGGAGYGTVPGPNLRRLHIGRLGRAMFGGNGNPSNGGNGVGGAPGNGFGNGSAGTTSSGADY